jgi:hypothetical protein
MPADLDPWRPTITRLAAALAAPVMRPACRGYVSPTQATKAAEDAVTLLLELGPGRWSWDAIGDGLRAHRGVQRLSARRVLLCALVVDPEAEVGEHATCPALRPESPEEATRRMLYHGDTPPRRREREVTLHDRVHAWLASPASKNATMGDAARLFGITVGEYHRIRMSSPTR